MGDPKNIGRYDWAVPPAQASSYVAAYQRRTSVFRSYTNNLADFGNVLGQKYGFVAGYNNPLIVETGCEAGDEHDEWPDDMRAAYNNFPLLFSVLWYNGRGQFPWTPTGPRPIPDWRTTPDVWCRPALKS